MSASTSIRMSWPADGAAVPAARRLLREHLREHDLGDLVDSAELLVSELVGNVVLHVGGTVCLSAVVQPGEVLVEVSDDSPVSPQLRTFSRTSSTGRGMRLVHSLAAEHGIDSRGPGKAIWARITRDTVARSDRDVAASFADVDWLAEVGDLDPDAGGPDAGQGAVLLLPDLDLALRFRSRAAA